MLLSIGRSQATSLLAVGLVAITLLFLGGSYYQHGFPTVPGQLAPLLHGSGGGDGEVRASRAYLRSFAAAAERQYQKTIELRGKHIAKNGGVQKLHAFPSPNTGFYTIWDYLIPTFSCPHLLSRVGILGDGGKWICGYEQVIAKPDCVVYSLGVNTESTFEAQILTESKTCTIYGYDYSVNQWGPDVFNHPEKARAHFFPYKMSGTYDPSANPPAWTLPALMEANGHKFVDILKIDIEGAEFDVIGALVDQYAGKPLPFGQMQLEIHVGSKSFADTLTWWEKLESAGLRPFFTEPNLPHVNTYHKSPDVSEWSFLSITENNDLLYG